MRPSCAAPADMTASSRGSAAADFVSGASPPVREPVPPVGSILQVSCAKLTSEGGDLPVAMRRSTSESSRPPGGSGRSGKRGCHARWRRAQTGRVAKGDSTGVYSARCAPDAVGIVTMLRTSPSAREAPRIDENATTWGARLIRHDRAPEPASFQGCMLEKRESASQDSAARLAPLAAPAPQGRPSRLQGCGDAERPVSHQATCRMPVTEPAIPCLFAGPLWHRPVSTALAYAPLSSP